MTPEQRATAQAERRRKIEETAAEIQRTHPVLDPTNPYFGPRSIAAIWSTVRLARIHKGAGDDELAADKMMFYWGCGAVLDLLNAISQDAVSEDEGAERLEHLHHEMREWSAAVKEGRA